MVDFLTDVGPTVLAGVPPGVDPIAHMRSCAPLPFNAEFIIDTAIEQVALDRLAIVDDLMSYPGMVYSLSNWLGVLNIKWQKVGRTGNPVFSMYPETQKENHRPDLSLDNLPVYCITDGWDINPRLWAVWQQSRGAETLDTGVAQQSVRRMNEAIELSFIEGPPIKIDGVQVPGILTSPDVGEVAFSGNLAWTNASKTPLQIVSDVRALRAAAKANGRYGPYTLYVGTAYDDVLDEDYKSSSADTVMSTRQRILQLSGIQKIVVADRFPADRVALIQTTNDVMDVIVGQQPAVVSWLTGPTAMPLRHWMTIACVIPRIKTTAEGQSGIMIGKPNLGDPNLPA